jgi:hypothetical protein
MADQLAELCSIVEILKAIGYFRDGLRRGIICKDLLKHARNSSRRHGTS